MFGNNLMDSISAGLSNSIRFGSSNSGKQLNYGVVHSEVDAAKSIFNGMMFVMWTIFAVPTGRNSEPTQEIHILKI